MKKIPESRFEILAVNFTEWIGSVQSLVVHTVLFALAFFAVALGYSLDNVLLFLTTIVSLEAIYLAIFIQMSVNRQSESIHEVEEDIDEIQEDVGEIQEDIDEIQDDVVEISTDIDEMQEEEDAEKILVDNDVPTIEKIRSDLERILLDIEKIKTKGGGPS